MTKWTHELLGWMGVVCIVAAYALTTLGSMPTHSMVYLWLNLVGAVCIAVDAFAQKNYQPVVLNGVWFAIAVVEMVRIAL